VWEFCSECTCEQFDLGFWGERARRNFNVPERCLPQALTDGLRCLYAQALDHAQCLFLGLSSTNSPCSQPADSVEEPAALRVLPERVFSWHTRFAFQEFVERGLSSLCNLI